MKRLGNWENAEGDFRYGLFALLLAILVAIVAAYIVILSPYKLGAVVRDLVPEGGKVQAPEFPKLVAAFRDVPPDMLTYSAGRHSGPLRYVLEEAASRIGYSVEWKQQSFSQSETAVAENGVDVIPYVHHKTSDRESKFRFSVSLGRETLPIYFVLKKDNPSVIQTMGDLAGHSVGYLKGRYYFAAFHAATNFKKIAYPSELALMQAFSKGEIELIATNNKMATERALKMIGLNDKKYANFIFKDKPDLYFLYSPNPQRSEVFDRLDQALVQMRAEGLIADIYHGFDVAAPE